MNSFSLPNILLQRLHLVKSDSFLILLSLLSNFLRILLLLESHSFFSVLAHGSRIEFTFRYGSICGGCFRSKLLLMHLNSSLFKKLKFFRATQAATKGEPRVFPG